MSTHCFNERPLAAVTKILMHTMTSYSNDHFVMAALAYQDGYYISFPTILAIANDDFMAVLLGVLL